MAALLLVDLPPSVSFADLPHSFPTLNNASHTHPSTPKEALHSEQLHLSDPSRHHLSLERSIFSPLSGYEALGSYYPKCIEDKESFPSLTRKSFDEAHNDLFEHAAFTDKGQELESRRNSKSRRSPLAIPQGSRYSQQQLTRYTVEAVHPPAARTIRHTGPSSVYMTVAVLIFGITAVLKKGGLFNFANSHVDLCEKCNGYGIEHCDICNGRGQITWEGKLKRADPCPLCFGSRVKKCSNCGGSRKRKKLEPLMEMAERQRTMIN